jgi:hypothetical protein
MKTIITSFSIFILTFLNGFGQKDISNEGFASFLFIEKEYIFAAQEYERLYFMQPDSLHYFKMWMKSSRLANGSDKVLQRLKLTPTTPIIIQWEYCKSAILSNRFDLVNSIIARNNLLDSTTNMGLNFNKMKSGLDLITNDKISENIKQLHTWFTPEIKLYDEMTRKSPLIAGVGSTILPGAGRLYVGEYTNAFLSLVFVAGAAYQSHARFKKDGVKSISGWIYGGISFGFYLGNIYGSIKSAKAYNRKKKSQIDEKVKSAILAL